MIGSLSFGQHRQKNYNQMKLFRLKSLLILNTQFRFYETWKSWILKLGFNILVFNQSFKMPFNVVQKMEMIGLMMF